MSKTRPVSFLSIVLGCLPLGAQEDAMALHAPAAELAKLKPLAGHWQGSGSATMAPGAPPTKWTAQMKRDWVLGGHWLMADIAIAFETGEKMRLREYLGWDRETKRYVNLSVDNVGEGKLVFPQLVGNDSLVTIVSTVRQGVAGAERLVTKFGGDAESFAMTLLGHGGPASEAVSGKFERVEKAEPEAIEAAAALMPADAEMAKLARMTGRFAVAGEMTMAPGAPAMKIKGIDEVRTLFDGAILHTTTTGTAEGMPGTYEAHGYYAWDAANTAYKVLLVSNMGEVMAGEARFAGDDKLIQTYLGVRMGQPYVARSVLHIDAKGKPVKVVNHSCMGTADPMQDFTGTYQPAAK